MWYIKMLTRILNILDKGHLLTEVLQWIFLALLRVGKFLFCLFFTVSVLFFIRSVDELVCILIFQKINFLSRKKLYDLKILDALCVVIFFIFSKEVYKTILNWGHFTYPLLLWSKNKFCLDIWFTRQNFSCSSG